MTLPESPQKELLHLALSNWNQTTTATNITTTTNIIMVREASVTTRLTY